MRHKIVGLFVCTLMIVALVLPATGIINKNTESNRITSPISIPNDPDFSKQWYLHNIGQVFFENLSGSPDADIDAPEAWDIEKGNPDVVIAILSSGIDYTHPDLASKIWTNTDEIPNNGIDDDSNGFIDDIRGWDFVYNDSNVTDGFGHGTMNAGVLGAVADNGIGIAGVGWDCTIMPMKISNESGQGTLQSISKGIRYAADNGADIISLNFGMGNFPMLKEAINYAYSKGVFLCASAGTFNSSNPWYPAAYDNVTAVAITNQNDQRCTPDDWGPGNGSNYGDWVDIAAPGNLIYSTMPTYHVKLNDQGFQQNYDYGKHGLTYATPIVAGVAALLLSKDPSLTPDEIETLLCRNVDPYISTEYIGTGRVNAQKALAALELSEGMKIKGGLGVSLVLTNNESVNLTKVTWKLEVNGGILGLINMSVNGTLDFNAGETKTVSTGLFLGLGSFTVNAWVSGVEKSAKGTQLFIFSLVK
jgi:subtilisin family serine protease